MRKLLVGILVLVMLFCFVGCGNNVKATVINNDGETEQLSAQELNSLSDGNSLSFKDKYVMAKVTVEGKIKEVRSSQTINGIYYDWSIVVNGGSVDWLVGKHNYTNTSIDESFLSTLNVGDNVVVSGEIVGVDTFYCNISNGDVSIEKK